MRRNVLAVMPVLVVLCGCQKPAAEIDIQDQQVGAPTVQTELFMVDPAADAAADREAVAYDDSPRGMSLTGDTVVHSSPESRTHQVTKGDTLYALARHYYDDQRRWKDIYEANRNQLPTPDALRIGQALRIP